MKSKIYEVEFANKRYPNDRFDYWIAASSVAQAIKKAEQLYRRDSCHMEGAKVDGVKLAGTVDA
jgi:hypothetical protein